MIFIVYNTTKNMIRHFFLDKTATIIKGKKTNTGLNPILSINYGVSLTRGLLHFDCGQISDWIEENGLDETKIAFKLKMTNCFYVDSLPYDKEIVSSIDNLSSRATSFDLELFKLKQPFDEGRGYEYASDFAIKNNSSYSESGVNWEISSGVTKWNKVGAYEDGSTIATQHFDFGNENLSVDITDYVLSSLNSSNYGLGLKFSNDLENTLLDEQQYVGFFTDHTNTFFHPYVEAIYDDYIQDDREAFYANKSNRLYLYVNDGELPVLLDEMPKCTIDEKTYTAKIGQAGAYYVEISNDFKSCKDMPIKYDTWSNIIIDGIAQDDVEMEFVVLPGDLRTRIGNVSTFKDMTVPSIAGINDNEELNRGEIREVIVDFRKKYTTDKKELDENSEYRIYIKDGRKEIDVFEYQPVERAFLNNFFVINTNDLIPGKYYIDIRTKHGRDLRYYKDVLHFIVRSNLTERYY